MSLSVGTANLREAYQTLAVRWDLTLPQWDDHVRRDFAETYWQPLEPSVQSSLRAMERIAQVILRMRQDCT